MKTSAVLFFISVLFAGLLPPQDGGAATGSTCESLFVESIVSSEDVEGPLLVLYEVLRTAQGRSVSDAGEKALVPYVMSLSRSYFDKNEIRYTEVLRTVPPSQTLRRVFLLEADQNSLVGRMVQQFKHRYPSHEVIYNPILMLDGLSAGIYRNKFVIASPIILMRPDLSMDVLLHELSHLELQNRIGMVSTDGPPIPSVGRRRKSVYSEFQSFDEPLSYEISLRIKLRSLRAALRERKRDKIDFYVDEVRTIARDILETSGRNVWVAAQIRSQGEELPTNVVNGENSGYVIETVLPTEGGAFYTRMPVSALALKSGTVDDVRRRLYAKVESEGRARLRHFRKFSSAAAGLDPKAKFEALERQTTKLWQLFVERPRFNSPTTIDK